MESYDGSCEGVIRSISESDQQDPSDPEWPPRVMVTHHERYDDSSSLTGEFP
ncbi:hypothetical protein HAX54_015202, partial [Datura stramonium]|nr:hypothetical protein [Datura stramonium]